MNIAFAIPHYYDPEGPGGNASLQPGREYRARALAALILSLHENFGRVQITANLSRAAIGQSMNAAQGNHVNIVVVTHGNKHTLAELSELSHLFAVHNVAPEQCAPQFLGVRCREVLASLYLKRPEYFDYYGYTEDDNLLHDPLFFDKLRLFTAAYGDDCLLLPNRYEVESSGSFSDKRSMAARIGIKLYCDAELEGMVPKEYPLFRTGEIAETVSLECLGRTVRFCRPGNPHAGCYFLNAEQMRRFMETPYFLEQSAEFIGPLESSATLGILKRFAVYKPHPDNANFLELQHFDATLLERVGVKRVGR